MKIYVNDMSVVLTHGMTVRHALISADIMTRFDSSWRVYDEWGNEMGLDGALSEGSRIYIRREDDSQNGCGDPRL